VAKTATVAAARDDEQTPRGWQRYGGVWRLNDDAYSAEAAPGAKAIWNQVALADGVVEADVKLNSPAGDGGLVLRVSQPTDGVDSLTAYNVNFQRGAIRLGKHQNNWRQLVREPFEFGVDRWHHLRVELMGPRVRIFVDATEEPVIDYVDEQPLAAGQVGLRTFNTKMSVKNLRVFADGKTHTAHFQHEAPTAVAATPSPGLAERRAWASLCLLVFNLNEFVYID
jgi:hypothetical protein